MSFRQLSVYHYKNTTPEEDKFIQHAATMIAIQRVEVPSSDGMLTDIVEKEIPIRLFNQLKKLWFGLDIIGVKDKYKIITEIVKGCGNNVRKGILEVLNPKIYQNYDVFEYKELSRKRIACMLNIDPREVLKHLMVLRALNCIDCKDDDIFAVESIWYPNPDINQWGETDEELLF